MITIYHNPRCSKSRTALALVQEFSAQRGETVQVVDYLKTPLSQTALETLRAQLSIGIREMIRDGEPEFLDQSLAAANDEQLLDAVARHPILLQRPIVVFDGRAVIARPPERITELFAEDRQAPRP